MKTRAGRSTGWARARGASQILWTAAVAVFAVRFAWTHGPEVAALELGAGGAWWALSLACVLAAKGLLCLMVHASWKAAGSELGLARAAYIYTLSQLPKYVPGGIWPYVSRVGMARARALELPRIWRGLALETALLLGGAVVLGAVTLEPAAASAVLGRDIPGPWVVAARAAAVAVLAVAGAAGLRQAADRKAFLGGAAASLVAWALIGVSFYAAVRGVMGAEAPGPVPASGLFALAWALGFVAFFSPAGIGVRELVLGLGLAGVGGAPEVAAVVVGPRLVYFAADVLAAGAAVLWLKERAA